jgi:hypothetical protein
MKVRFKAYICGEAVYSDRFNFDYNPYKVGDTIKITGIIYNKVQDKKDLVESEDVQWNGTFKVVDIVHKILLETILTQNYTHDSCTIVLQKM